MPFCLAISCRLHLLSHVIRLCTSSTTSSVVARSFIILHTLPPSPKFSSPFLHHATRRRVIPKGFNEVMNSLRTHALLTEEILFDCSTTLSQFNTPFACLQQIPTETNSFEILFSLPKMLNKIELSTDWSFISIYSF